MATDKQKVLILKMCEAHFNVKVFEFTIYRGKPSAWHAFKGNRTNWSPTKRARAKTVKEYKRMVLNNEWTKHNNYKLRMIIVLFIFCLTINNR